MSFYEFRYEPLQIEELKEGRYYSCADIDVCCRIEGFETIIDKTGKEKKRVLLTVISGENLEHRNLNGYGKIHTVEDFLQIYSRLVLYDAERILDSNSFLKVVDDHHIEEMSIEEIEMQG